ncbi:MAG: hypothetical protein JEZ03_16010, partial [Bacteroidales bacterium]|nr:hypothetical protein [Bacteroidales bacterium]
IDSIKVDLKCNQEQSNIWYRIIEGATDTVFRTYREPFYIDESSTIEAYTVSALKAPSPKVRIPFTQMLYHEASELDQVNNGVKYQFFTGSYSSVTQLDIPVRTGVYSEPDISIGSLDDGFGFIFKGFIDVPKDGMYTIYLNSDDGSCFYIHDQLFINNDGRHGTKEERGQVALRKGLHPFTLKYIENVGDQMLKIEWESMSIDREKIPVNAWKY